MHIRVSESETADEEDEFIELVKGDWSWVADLRFCIEEMEIRVWVLIGKSIEWVCEGEIEF